MHENFENSARSNPTARRGRNHLEFFKIFMHTWGEAVRTLDGTEYTFKTVQRAGSTVDSYGPPPESSQTYMGRRFGWSGIIC